MAEIFTGVWFAAQWLCSAFAGWIIFRKAGIAGWKSIVPLYSGILYYGLVWEKGFYCLYLFGVFVCVMTVRFAYTIPLVLLIVFAAISIAAGVIRAVFCYKLAKGFGKGLLYAAGLFLLEPVFKVLLAAGACEFENGDTSQGQAEAKRGAAYRKLAGAGVCLALALGYAANIYVQCTCYVWITEDNFPDKNFRSYLRSQPYGSDLKLSDSEIGQILYIECNECGITTLEGIELLPKVIMLECAGNELTTLDLSRNGFVKYLDCTDNDIEELKLSRSGWLRSLLCSGNRVSELELGCYADLYELDCRDNNLTSLDMRANEWTETLLCSGNSILRFRAWDRKSDKVFRELESDGQVCEVPVVYDEESGVYKSAEGIMDPLTEVKGEGVTFDSENGQLTVEDPQKCEAKFRVKGSLRRTVEEDSFLISGELHFVEADPAE